MVDNDQLEAVNARIDRAVRGPHPATASEVVHRRRCRMPITDRNNPAARLALKPGLIGEAKEQQWKSFLLRKYSKRSGLIPHSSTP
ncbi:hypothetical protein [Acidovorax cavernicola]|uniref:hypothetical protein n=1 Tax=Acidovorax cavernicola TaxID=1675792 RepID=UPI0011C35D8F|nr:hypothetical protein [Acidovorax cavernicola]